MPSSSRHARSTARPARRPSAVGAPRSAVALCTWQIATASASARRAATATASSPSSSFTICCDLLLLGAAEADDRALDLRRRVLGDRHAGRRRREQRDAARVAEAQRAADVPGVEDVLDGDAVRPVLGEQRREPA